MKKELLPQNVNWYKANLHNHTTVSDGKLTPEESRDAYKALGYSILAHTDHSVMVSHQNLNQEDFLMLTGVEIDMEEDNVPAGLRRSRHLCLLSRDPNMQWVPFKDPSPIPASVPYEAGCSFGDLSRAYDYDAMNAVIAACNRMGCLVTYNHPVWSLESYPDYAPLKGLWAMEYRNSAGIGGGFDEDAGIVYQDLLKLGNRIMPVMADDTHDATAPRSGMPVLGRSWTVVGAQKLEYQAVMEALERGDLYSSCGPEIHSLTLEDGILTVTCSPAVRVQMITHARFCRQAWSEKADVEKAEFDISYWLENYCTGPEAFLRLIVTAADGSYATTRAYWYEELKV